MRLPLATFALFGMVAACSSSTAEDPGICRLPTMIASTLLLGDQDYSGNIARIAVTEDFSSGRDAITIRFDEQGRERFATQSTEMVGKDLPVRVDDRLVTSPRIVTPIIGGTVHLNGNYTRAEALDIAKSLAPVCPPANK